MTRAFVSIDIPPQIKEEIKKIQNKLPEFIGKKTETENLHLTLKFLGEISEEELKEIKEKLKEVKIARFRVEIDSIGIFSKNFIRIVWIHINGCEQLQKEIDEKLSEKFEKEERFMSHMTIARVKNLRNKEKFLEDLKKIEIPKIDFSVDSFKLKKSTLKKEGPEYLDIGEYLL